MTSRNIAVAPSFIDYLPPTTFTGHCEFCNNNVKLRGNHVALRNVNRKFIFLKIVVISKSGGGK